MTLPHGMRGLELAGARSREEVVPPALDRVRLGFGIAARYITAKVSYTEIWAPP